MHKKVRILLLSYLKEKCVMKDTEELSAKEINKMFYERIEVSRRLESGFKFSLLFLCVSVVVFFCLIHQIVYSEILRLVIEINSAGKESIGNNLLMLTYAKYVSACILVGLVVAMFCLFTIARNTNSKFPERKSKVYKALFIVSLIASIFITTFATLDCLYRVLFMQISESLTTLRSAYLWFGGNALAVGGIWLAFINSYKVNKIMSAKKLEAFTGEI